MNYVLGGEGFIGSNVIQAFSAIPLEYNLLDNPADKLLMLQADDIVFHAAHKGSVDDCATDPASTRTVNVTGSLQFFAEVKKLHAIPVYFSTNMVFSGEKAYYSVFDIPKPNTEYGRQKREVEEYIMNNFSKYFIIRMTKVYGPESGSFLDSWIAALKSGKEVRAAKDMYAAPVFVGDVMSNLKDFLANSAIGIHHLSGSIERSMEEIAKLVIAHIHADESLLKTISIADLDLLEKRLLHNSLACGTVRDILEVLQSVYS